MITLIEPPCEEGTTSGGYRYQACVFEQLHPQQGRKITATVEELPALVERLRRDEPDALLVVDGLFAELGSGPLPRDTIALLHMVPTRADWCAQPMHVLATSATTADAVSAQSRTTAIVRPGLDACFDQGRIARNPEDATQIVCVGTIREAKSQARLVQLLKAIRQPWQLALIGSYDPKGAEFVRVCQHGEGRPVAIQGTVSIEEVAYRFARADLLVSLSRNESFGMAVAEAAAAGLPALALDTGEIRSFLEPGKNGWLLPNDAEDGVIVDYLQDLLIRPDKLEAAKAARMRPRLHSWREVAQRFAAACVATRSGS